MLQRGEVVLIRIDFHRTPGGKLRPAVAPLDSGEDDFGGPAFTSRLRTSDFDVSMRKMAGLPSRMLTMRLPQQSTPVTCSWGMIGGGRKLKPRISVRALLRS